MKLIIAIVNSEDASAVLSELTSKGFSVTKLSTSGGFLRAGNVTMLIGLEEEKVAEALSVIEEFSCQRKQQIPVNSDISATRCFPCRWKSPWAARRSLCWMWSSSINYEPVGISTCKRGTAVSRISPAHARVPANRSHRGRRRGGAARAYPLPCKRSGLYGRKCAPVRGLPCMPQVPLRQSPGRAVLRARKEERCFQGRDLPCHSAGCLCIAK